MNLDLLSYKDQLSVKKDAEGKLLVFDPLRKKWLVLLPEEMVRQLLILYLLDQGFSKSHIAIEKAFTINGRTKRFDLLVFNKKMKPILLVECKAPSIKINEQTFEQISNYNYELNVPYWLVTNGINTYICRIDKTNKTNHFLSSLPKEILKT